MNTTPEMIACAERELRMRRRVYPRWVQQERMSQTTADHEIACMQSILLTLQEKLAGEPFKLDGGKACSI